MGKPIRPEQINALAHALSDGSADDAARAYETILRELTLNPKLTAKQAEKAVKESNATRLN